MPTCDLIRVDPLFLNLTWREDRLETISLEWSERTAAGRQSALITPWAEPFRDSLAHYLAKEEPAWPEVPLAGVDLSDFAWKVLQRLRTVPTGAWLSYGQLATECGRPKAARAVGRVMARNPWPLLFPCHRVLGRSGQLTGFGPGLDMKQYLLAHEGIPHVPVNRGAL